MNGKNESCSEEGRGDLCIMGEQVPLMVWTAYSEGGCPHPACDALVVGRCPRTFQSFVFRLPLIDLGGRGAIRTYSDIHINRIQNKIYS